RVKTSPTKGVIRMLGKRPRSPSLLPRPEPLDVKGERTMTRVFEYGVTSIKDLQVKTRTDSQGRSIVESLELDGRPVQPSQRFWNSLHVRFGFTGNIFRYFSHAEVFQRISQVAPNDQIRWCLEGADEGPGTLLAVTSPTAASISYDDLME